MVSSEKVEERDLSNEQIHPTPDTAGDPYLSAEILLPRLGHDAPQYAKVTKRRKDHDGCPIGTANSNPRLDSRSYIVEVMDGHQEALSANLIAEHMFSQIDEEGQRFQIIEEIVNHRVNRSKALSYEDSFLSGD